MLKKAIFSFVITTLTVAFVMAQIIGFNPSLDILNTSGQFLPELEIVVLEQELTGVAGEIDIPTTGQLDGAGVVGHVFPTNLSPSTAGFGNAEGILAIAVTSHPDFDDTPMFDENQDDDYANDGASWHSHWVVLTGDERVAGGLAVKQFDPSDSNVMMPPTNPGLPMYLDSPGFPVVMQENKLKVLVPSDHLKGNVTFNFDAVTAYMQVNTSSEELPLLGVYEVYKVLSGDLSLPYSVQ